MLTTKKWSPDPSARRPSNGRLRPVVVLCLTALVAALFTGCEPPGPAALRRGERLLAAGRPADAIEPFKEAVTRLATNAPACALAWNQLGLAYHQAGQLNDAAQAYQNALAKDFNLFAARYNRGLLFLEVNNLPGAINELTTFTTHQPSHPGAWLKLGLAQLRARQWDAAERSFKEVLPLKASAAQKAEALTNLGVIQAQRRRPHEAMLQFHAALREVTNHPPALLNQAVVAQVLMADRATALDRYRAFLAAAPNAPEAGLARVQVRRLEEELKPVTPVVTNPPPAAVIASNLTSRLATNVVRVAPTSSPPAQITPSVVAASNRPPVLPIAPPPTSAPPAPAVIAPPTHPVPAIVATPTNVPAPAAEPPIEVVKVEDDPALKPGDTIAPPPLPKPVAFPASNAPPVTAPAPLRSLPPPKSEKKSVWQRMNPVGWFGGRDKNAPAEPVATEPKQDKAVREKEVARPKTTPLPGAPMAGTPTPVAVVPPPRPVFPRYPYLSPSASPATDHAAVQAVFDGAVKAHTAGQLGAAVEGYRRVVAVAPDWFDAWYNLGVALHQEGEVSASLSAYEQALALRPADAGARYNFALALGRAGYATDSAAELERLLAANPANTEAHLALGVLAAETLADRERARTHYQRVLELSPRHPQAAEIRRWLAANR